MSTPTSSSPSAQQRRHTLMRRAIASFLIGAMLVVVAVFSGTDSRVAAATISFNQGLEQVNSTTQSPTGWVRDTFGTNTGTWGLTSAAHGGSVASVVKISAYSSGDRKLLSPQSNGGLPVTVGTSYDLSAWYQTSGTSDFAVFRKTSSGWKYWTSGPVLKKTSTWTRATLRTPPVPSGTTGISFGIVLESVGRLVTDDYGFAQALSTTTTAPSSTSTSSTSSSSSSSSSTSSTSTTTSPSTTTTVPGGSTSALLSDSFAVPDGLITNEYAFWNPGAAGSTTSPTWEMTSGSLFARAGTAWSGVPDSVDPNSTSSNGTNSAIFRLVTRRKDFTNVSVSFRLRRDGLTSTAATPAVAWDGEHIFLRYASETSLYYASFDRRDGTTAIKKKVTGGTSNGGTYYTLASGRGTFAPGVFHAVRATVIDNPDGSATIRLWVDGTLVLSATDTGIGGPVIRSGGVGIRGDNADFSFDDFLVTTP